MHFCSQMLMKEPKQGLTEEDAITFLKGKGYKIMKPIVEYTEI